MELGPILGPILGVLGVTALGIGLFVYFRRNHRHADRLSGATSGHSNDTGGEGGAATLGNGCTVVCCGLHNRGNGSAGWTAFAPGHRALVDASSPNKGLYLFSSFAGCSWAAAQGTPTWRAST